MGPLLRGLEALAAGSCQLDAGLTQFHSAADDVPLFSGRLVEGLSPIEDGTRASG